MKQGSVNNVRMPVHATGIDPGLYSLLYRYAPPEMWQAQRVQPPGPAWKVSVRCTLRWQRLCCGSLPIGACAAKVTVGKAAGEAVVLASTHDLLHACLLRVRVSWG